MKWSNKGEKCFSRKIYTPIINSNVSKGSCVYQSTDTLTLVECGLYTLTQPGPSRSGQQGWGINNTTSFVKHG